MKLEFVKLSPAQNMTVIVKTPVPRRQQSDVAGRLIDYAGVFAEQAGFIEPPTLPGAECRLQMMGGEFCGNATMCMAALTARDGGIQPGETRDINVEISGAEGVLNCRVSCTEDGYVCKTRMPLPESVEKLNGYSLVRLPGITHAILKCAAPASLRTGAEEMLREIAALLDDEAVGLMLYSPATAEMIPLVYVKATDTMIWERGCGSGSAAVGALAAWEKQADVQIPLLQPGGTITAAARWNDGLAEVSIEGRVRIVCEGVAYV